MKKSENKNLISLKTLKSISEFDDHFLVLPISNKSANLEGFISIHRRNKNLPSFGATRLWSYSSKKDALRDSLRLSRLMSYKSAMAGLPYGGAKAVIIKPKGSFSRKKLLKAYSDELNKLNGFFVTGTDVGLSVSDLEYMKKYTKYLIGYSANPEVATGMSVAVSLNSALNFIYKNKKYSNYSFAIQGVGKVGKELLKILIDGGASRIYISDIDNKKIKDVITKYPNVKVVGVNEIHKQEVDVYCPCALSGALNSKTIKELKCKIIVGSANNQLSDNSVGYDLYKKGILYCPDYIVNSGGLISVIDEYLYKDSDSQRLTKKINKIGPFLSKIFKESANKKIPAFVLSGDIGLKIINKNN